MFLMETLIDANKMEPIQHMLGYEGMFVVANEGHNGGLVMLWKDKKSSNSIYTPSISFYTPLERWGENIGVCDMGCREKKMECK